VANGSEDDQALGKNPISHRRSELMSLE